MYWINKLPIPMLILLFALPGTAMSDTGYEGGPNFGSGGKLKSGGNVQSTPIAPVYNQGYNRGYNKGTYYNNNYYGGYYGEGYGPGPYGYGTYYNDYAPLPNNNPFPDQSSPMVQQFYNNPPPMTGPGVRSQIPNTQTEIPAENIDIINSSSQQRGSGQQPMQNRNNNW